MEVLINKARTGAEQMSLDRALVDIVRESREPMARLYSWQPYAVSLGYNQDESQISKEHCAEHGIDIVRRPTGGRAVLHAEEITYAVITPLGDRTAQEWYATIHQTIAEGLVSIGLNDAVFVKSQPKFAELYKQSSGALCFSSSARYELEWQSKKFVGSAQRVIDGVLLQHGSILLGSYHVNLPELLNLDDAKRASMKNILLQRSISIGEILSRPISFEECCIPLRESFQHLPERIAAGELTA